MLTKKILTVRSQGFVHVPRGLLSLISVTPLHSGPVLNKYLLRKTGLKKLYFHDLYKRKNLFLETNCLKTLLLERYNSFPVCEKVGFCFVLEHLCRKGTGKKKLFSFKKTKQKKTLMVQCKEQNDKMQPRSVLLGLRGIRQEIKGEKRNPEINGNSISVF